jgi:hypothetical protein
MSDSYQPRDVNAMVRRVAKIIEGGNDAKVTATACVIEVLNLRYKAGGFHFKGFTAEDIEEILMHLGAEWDEELSLFRVAS